MHFYRVLVLFLLTLFFIYAKVLARSPLPRPRAAACLAAAIMLVMSVLRARLCSAAARTVFVLERFLPHYCAMPA